jgi:hypothetical protein
MEKMIITIKPDGTMTVDAAGYQGGKCITEQDALEAYINKTAGIASHGKTQKKKLEQMYSKAPGEKAKY